MTKKIQGGQIVFTISDDGSLVQLGKGATKAGKQVGSVAKNVQESDRRLKSLSQQTSNTTKAFAKQAQTIGTGLVPIYATIAAQVFAVSAAFRFLSDSFDTRNLIEGQKQFGSITGVAYQTLTKRVQDAADGMLKFNETASAVAIGVASGLTASQLERLGAAAKNASLALGRDVADSFNRLIRGVTKAEPELLDELGIILRLDPALRKYALSINKAHTELNAFERTQAVTNFTLDQAEVKFGRISQIMDPDNFALQQFAKDFDDLAKTIKVGVANFLTPVIGSLKDNIYTLIGVFGLLAAPIVSQLMPNFGAFGDKMQQLSNMAKASSETFRNQANAVRLLGDNVAESQKKLRASGQKGISSMLSGFSVSKDDPKTVRQAFSGKELSATQIRTLKTMATKRQGIFNSMTKTELSIFRGYLNQLSASNKTTMKQMEADLSVMATRGSVAFNTLKAIGTSTFAALARGAAIAGKAVSMFLNYFGWISLAYTAAMVIYDLGKKFFGAADQLNYYAERSKKLREELTLLNDELARMVQVRGLGYLAGAAQGLEQIGNALKSTDLLKLMQDFNAEIKAGTLTEEQRANYVKTAENLALLDTRFEKLVQEFKGGEIAIKGNDFLIMANSIMTASMALAQMSEQVQSVDRSIANFVGGAKARPFAGMSTNIAALVNEETGALGTNTLTNLREQQKQLRSTATGRMSALQQQQLAFGGVQALLDYQEKTGKGVATTTFSQGGAARLSAFRKYQGTAVGQDFLKDFSAKDIQAIETYLQSGVTPMGSGGAVEKFQQKIRPLGLQEQIDDQTKVIELLDEEDTLLNEKQDKADAYNSLLTKMKTLQEEGVTLAQNAVDLQIQEIKNSTEQGYLKKGQNAFEMESLKAIQKIDEADLDVRMAKLAVDELSATADAEQKKALEDQVTLAQQKLDIANAEYDIQQKLGQIYLDQITARTAQMGDRVAGGSMFNSFENKMQEIFATEEFAKAQAASGDTMEVYKQKVTEATYAQEQMRLSMELQTGVADKLTNGLADGVANALVAVAQGTKSAKEAFGQMAISILADITTMIIRTMILKAIMGSMTGGVGLLARQGGILTPGGTQGGGYRSYAVGGIADGPDSGYTATLHGREAVVPLGNDKSIPVKMLNGGGGNNNVNIEINMDNGSSNMTADGAKGFAYAIQAAVTDAIVKEQRSGGLLSGGQ